MNDKHVQVTVRELPDNVKDVFWGTGWDNWSRIRLVTNPKNDFLHIAGIKLPWNVRMALARYLRVDLR